MLPIPSSRKIQTDPEASPGVCGSRAELNIAQKQRRRALIVPREHGAWGMLLIPLLTGGAVGHFDGGRLFPVLLLTLAVLALFWLRTPLESLLGTGSIRVQTRQERQTVLALIVPLATFAAVVLSARFGRGNYRNLVWLGTIAGVAFAAQIFLKKAGRATRMAAEVVGALTLTSTAPAAYCVATGRLDAKAWILWLLNWLFAADQVHFVWLRIRGMRAEGLRKKLDVGWSFLAGNLLLAGILVLARGLNLLPLVARSWRSLQSLFAASFGLYRRLGQLWFVGWAGQN